MIEYFRHRFIQIKLYNGKFSENEWNSLSQGDRIRVYYLYMYGICEVCKLKFNLNDLNEIIKNNMKILTCDEQIIKNLLE
jgi:hypothetical protein